MKSCEGFKIFDASQYLSSILTKDYQSPFDMGFDMVVTTLHKNYPGPQKGLIAVKKPSNIWKAYLADAKTYISNTHPLDIANSFMPLLDTNQFKTYVELNEICSRQLEEALIKKGIPVVLPKAREQKTMHTWIKCNSQKASYAYFLKLQALNLLTNYRILPYSLGYGLRIGTSAAVRTGLRPEHIDRLSSIMVDAYYGEITPKLKRRCDNLINKIHQSSIVK